MDSLVVVGGRGCIPKLFGGARLVSMVCLGRTDLRTEPQGVLRGVIHRVGAQRVLLQNVLGETCFFNRRANWLWYLRNLGWE